jgi:hypothetical protein
MRFRVLTGGIHSMQSVRSFRTMKRLYALRWRRNLHAREASVRRCVLPFLSTSGAEITMTPTHSSVVSRRGFCFCCLASTTFAATGGWLSPREAFAEARGLVSLIKDSAAVSPIVTHRLRNNISVLGGSGGNVAVLTGPDGRVLIDAGIGVSRLQMTKALDKLGAAPVTHLINTHWHFDHTDGNAC